MPGQMAGHFFMDEADAKNARKPGVILEIESD
jgi:hypothetical protein